MYSAFFIQPQVEKEARVVRCDPFVQKYTVAVFVLRSQRRKDKMGGVLVGDSENLKKCWSMIEQNDGKFSDDTEKVMMAISEIAMANKCAVVFQQAGDEPTFSELEDSVNMIHMLEATRACLDRVSQDLIDAGVLVHVNPAEYYDVDGVGQHVDFRVSRFAVGSHIDIAEKVNQVVDAKYPAECSFTFSGDAGSLASVVFDNGVNVKVVSDAGTQERFLLTASFKMSPQDANDLVVDYKNKTLATGLFKQIATADNIFMPRNVARGVLTKVGLQTPDAIMYDLSIDHVGSKLMPVMDTLFGTDAGVRGAVLAYGFEGGIKDKLFLLKGPALTAEGPAIQRCWEILQEMYQEEEDQEPAAPPPNTGVPPPAAKQPPKQMKKPTMTYFKFRI